MIQDLGRDWRLKVFSVVCPGGVLASFWVGLACFPTPVFAQLNLTPDDSLGTTVEALNLQSDLVTGC